MFNIESYDFHLPEEQIAQIPHDPVDACKLLYIDRDKKKLDDHQFNVSLLWHCSDNQVIFFNNSKVVKARIILNNVVISFEGKERILKDAEMFYLWIHKPWVYQFMVRPWSKFPIWSRFRIYNSLFTVIWNWEYGRLIQFDGDIYTFLQQYGQMPLPPYIVHKQEKEALYQPVIAKTPWSVASPTASLHFTTELLDKLISKWVTLDYVTLHVGIGTFRTIKTSNIKNYDIHSEQCEIDYDLFHRIYEYKSNAKKIIAVGTTSCRTLESLPYVWYSLSREKKSRCSDSCIAYRNNILDIYWIHSQSSISHVIEWNENIQFDCKLFITPGFSLKIIDELITNFHLPKSSLLVLVASIMGYEFMMHAYEHAIKKNYMFYSFWDAMWIR